MAKRYDFVARYRAAPNRAVPRPAFRIGKEPLDRAVRDSPIVNRKPQIDVYQCVGCGESLEYCSAIPVAIYDPGFSRQKTGVQFQVLVVRQGRAALLELQFVKDVERKPRDLDQLPSQGRFSTAGIPEYGHS